MLKRVVRIQSLSLRGTIKTHAKTGVTTTATQAEVDAVLLPKFLEAMYRERDQIQSGVNPRNFKSHSVIYGQGKLPIPPLIINDPSPIKTKNKDFKRRSALGEIVLSPYKKWGAVIEFKNGVIEDRHLVNAPVYYNFNTYAKSLGVFADSRGILVGDYYWIGGCTSIWWTIYNKEEVTPYELGWINPTPLQLNAFLHSQPIKTGMVTENLGNHNTRTVDALTALAELPETASMIINACKTCLRMYIDARKKAFRLQNKVSEWKNAKTSDRNRRQILRNIEEATTAIAEVWLTFRYGIMPNVYLIEDLVKAYNASDTLFLRDRKREQDSSGYLFDTPLNWLVNSTVPVDHRTMVKSRLEPNATKLDTQSSFRIFTTAWELIPLSFVVDWFINVGDMLAATIPAAYAAQGATYSWKADHLVVYNHESGATVTIRYKAYRMIVIDPLQYCKFEWSPSLNADRYRDSVSLVWKIFIERQFRKLS